MKINGTDTIACERGIVWALLMDAQCWAGCISGCAQVVATAGNAWDVTVMTGTDRSAPRFRGRWVLTQLDEPNGFIVAVDGGGLSVGRLRATVGIGLCAQPDRVTEITYQIDVQFGGAFACFENNKTAVQHWCQQVIRALAVRCETDPSNVRQPLKRTWGRQWVRWLKPR